MKARYYFEQYFLPMTLQSHALRLVNALIDKRGKFLYAMYKAICEQTGEECKTESRDYSVQSSRLTDDTALLTLKMPDAGWEVPDCGRVYILADSDGKKFSYFTVEHAEVPDGEDGTKPGFMLCGRREDAHFNFGVMPQDEAEAIKLMLAFHNDIKPE